MAAASPPQFRLRTAAIAVAAALMQIIAPAFAPAATPTAASALTPASFAAPLTTSDSPSGFALTSTHVSAAATERPQLQYRNGTAQLLLEGKPFLMLGGELGNSSAGTAAQADAILPQLAAQHFNTVLLPVAAPYDALYAFGQARAIGFSAFGVDDPHATNSDTPALADVYRILRELGDSFVQAQQRGDTRALILHLTSPRPTQTVALGGYLFRATLAREWRTQKPLTADGAMLVMPSAPGEFYILGSGLTVSFLRDPDVDGGTAGIAGIARLTWKEGRWTVAEQMNGDQSDQGRELLMDAHAIYLYRISLYSYPRR